jgi:hypothetical protein
MALRISRNRATYGRDNSKGKIYDFILILKIIMFRLFYWKKKLILNPLFSFFLYSTYTLLRMFI